MKTLSFTVNGSKICETNAGIRNYELIIKKKIKKAS